MKLDKHTLDQLLSSKMEGFEAQPPAGVWEAIQTELPLPNAPADAASASKSIVGGAKSIGVLGKIALVASSAIVLSTAVYYATERKELVQKEETLLLQNTEESFGLNQNDIDARVETQSAPTDRTIAFSKATPKKSDATLTLKEIATEIPSDDNKVSQSIPVVGDFVETYLQKEQGKLPEVKKEVAVEEEKESVQLPESQSSSASEHVEKKQPKFTTAFSPNGDGKNDTWFIDAEELTEYHLTIYNSNGQLVFESTKAEEHWNGQDIGRGELCEEGKYAFILNYKFINEAKMNTTRGIIKLFR